MMDRKTVLLVLAMELNNAKQALDKMYTENSKRFDDMQTSLSLLETDLAKDKNENN